VAALAAAVLVLGACGTDSVPAPGPAKIDVDTPQLRHLKQEAGVQACRPGDGEPVDGGLPDVTLPCLGGGPDVRLRGTPSGVPTLVNVYGSWCAPCQEEMPLLVSFARKAGSRVVLLGVDTEDEPRTALQFAKDLGQHWPAVVDAQGAVLRRYAPGPPVTLFVDARGRVVHVQRGKFASLAQLEAAVATHLGVRL
jgi:thiol-disulfide isomerase/thioredoxin